MRGYGRGGKLRRERETFFPSSVVGSWPVPTGSETITDDNCIVMEC